VGVRQRHFGTGFPLLGCEVEVERRKVLFNHVIPRRTRGVALLTSAHCGFPLSSNIPLRLSNSDNEHAPSSVHPSKSRSTFFPRPRVTTCSTVSPSSLSPTHPEPNTIRSTSHVRALSGAKTGQKRSGVLAGGGGRSCSVARCFKSAGGCAITCARVGERRGVRTRSRSDECVAKCRMRREGSEGGILSKLAKTCGDGHETHWAERLHQRGGWQ
jgi:hypothetical protein